jgi:hypothetical protein
MSEPIEMIELIVMLKAGHKQEDVAPLAESLKAQVLEVRLMFDHKVVGLIALPTKAAQAALTQLQADQRVEIAQINRTYKHC